MHDATTLAKVFNHKYFKAQYSQYSMLNRCLEEKGIKKYTKAFTEEYTKRTCQKLLITAYGGDQGRSKVNKITQ